MPSKGNTKGPLISPVYSIERQRRYLSSAIVCAKRMHFFSLFFRLSIYPQLRSLDLPREILLRADPTFALIVKARCVGRRKQADEGTGKGTWKWKATFQASRCGEGSPATKDDRTLRANAPAHRDRHVLFKVTGPPTPHNRPFAQRRPGALYWNSADRLSWLCEERSRRPALSTIARICLNAIAQSYSILRSFEHL